MTKGRRARRRNRAAPAHALPRRVPAQQTTTVYLDGAELHGAMLPTREPPPVEPEPVATQPLPAELTYPRHVTVEELTGGKDDATLTAELAAKLLQIPQCQHCGGRHARACPRVKRMSFHPNSALAEVEFWPEGKWTDADIIWPEDLAATE